MLVTRVEKLIGHFFDVVLAVLGKLHGDFLKNHVVLSQGASFVRKHELNAA